MKIEISDRNCPGNFTNPQDVIRKSRCEGLYRRSPIFIRLLGVSHKIRPRPLTKKIQLLGAVCLLCIFLLPSAASAGREKIILDFDDNYYHAGRGEKATLYLRREVKQQYPGFNLKGMNLEKVVLVAKSKMGYGRAQLRVGENVTREKRIDGNPDQYHDNRRFTFDRAVFHNPAGNSRGRWQIHLRGNFVVRRVILVVNDCNCRCDGRGYGDWAYRGRTFGTRMYTWEWPINVRRRHNNW